MVMSTGFHSFRDSSHGISVLMDTGCPPGIRNRGWDRGLIVSGAGLYLPFVAPAVAPRRRATGRYRQSRPGFGERTDHGKDDLPPGVRGEDQNEPENGCEQLGNDDERGGDRADTQRQDPGNEHVEQEDRLEGMETYGPVPVLHQHEEDTGDEPEDI